VAKEIPNRVQKMSLFKRQAEGGIERKKAGRSTACTVGQATAADRIRDFFLSLFERHRA